MSKTKLFFPLLLSAMLFFPGCDLIEDIFQAGVWFAIIAVLIIAALIYLIFSVGEKPVENSPVLSKTETEKRFRNKP